MVFVIFKDDVLETHLSRLNFKRSGGLVIFISLLSILYVLLYPIADKVLFDAGASLAHPARWIVDH